MTPIYLMAGVTVVCYEDQIQPELATIAARGEDDYEDSRYWRVHKGVLLLLLGPLAVLTANPISLTPRPLRPDAWVAGWAGLAAPLLLLASFLWSPWVCE